MTVIVGYYDKKTEKCYVGSDRGLFGEGTGISSQESKIIKKRVGTYNGKPIDMIIGNAGDVKPGNLITHWQTGRLKFDPTQQTNHEFIVKVFVPKMKELFEKNGYKKPDFEILLALDCQLFIIQEDYSVIIPPDWGAGCGSGAIPALGVLYALNKEKLKIPPRRKIQLALEAAVKITDVAKEPFDILSV